MGSQLHQTLRSMCYYTGWNYAVFWKLKHRARMMLTWEDAYYNNHEEHEPSENNCSVDITGNFNLGHFSSESLGLAVAKMSYHVYSLGEGIVGKVAATGKHLWISADKHVADSCSLFEYSDGWQTQFSAGIRTIAFVAVVPHGVLQLGSLKNIEEDLKLVNHIREIFIEHYSLAGHVMDSSSCLSDLSTESLAQRTYYDCMKNNRTTLWSPMFPSHGKSLHHSCTVSQPDGYPKKRVINMHGGPENSMSGVGESSNLIQSDSMEQPTRIDGNLVTDGKSERETSGYRDAGVRFKKIDAPCVQNFFSNKSNLYDATPHADNYVVDISYLPSVIDTAPAPSINQNLLSCAPEPSNIQYQADSEMKELQTEINNTDTFKTSFSFFAGCELYEALGPAFKKQNTDCDWKTEKTETESAVEVPVEGIGSSNSLTLCPGTEHLLEAVVAKGCQSVSDVKHENPITESLKSLLTTENVLEATASDMHTISSAGYSFDQSSLVEEDKLHRARSSGTCAVRSSNGLSSTSNSRCSERTQELGKSNKKRARPGENCRPRPRDRQLIQDRIKELRELVPNGSKCSIDSLLERTIKHMLFMQCVTKHADKLDKCTESKLLDKKTGVHGSSTYERGSSWAMEVGSQLKVCPIMVENINMEGQMLVEMLCEDCNHFLEIAEAIRSLGLTILKGVTEPYGEKIWICFVVEGQNNRIIHRMDVLWSLVQLLQPNTKI